MTNNDKIVAGKLLEECSISALTPECIRVLDATGHPVMKVDSAFFYEIRPLLRKRKMIFLLNLSKVRSMHGNSFLKKLYKGKAVIPDKQNTPP